MSLFVFLLWFHLIKACDPPVTYPTIMNIQLLSSIQNQIVLTMQNKDSTIVCVTFDIDEFIYSDEMDCSTYTNDILEFSSNIDTTTTRINSIASDQGIDITRDTHSFIIKWNEIPDITNITIDSSEIESFTLDSKISNEYTTFIRLSDDDIYAIKFESELSNNYNIYVVQSNEYFNLESGVKSYEQYKYIQFMDKFISCDKSILYQYDVTISEDNYFYNLNLTLIDTAYNIGIDTRTNFGYFWGYSSAFTIFDILEDEIWLHRYAFVPDEFEGGSKSKAFTIKSKSNLYAFMVINVVVMFHMYK
eukprot:432057_1